jgi:Icc-related predicted phosphoesterase
VSDLHGKREQYQKLASHAKKISADTIIIGGDITPNPGGRIDFGEQRRFLQNYLPMSIISLRIGLPKCKVYLMPGNDDCASNLDVLEQQKELYTNIHGKRIQLTPDLELVGYSYVPITPFGLKDWEKFDLSIIPPEYKEAYEMEKRINYKLDGFKTRKNNWDQFVFTPEMELSDSIQKDLKGELFTKSPEKTIYVSHTPPYNTNLDKIIRSSPFGSLPEKISIGSIALRLFIEDYQPYLTLHGHIHETVVVSGSFRDKIGKTLCLAPGNHPNQDKLAAIVFDAYGVEHAQRILL